MKHYEIVLLVHPDRSAQLSTMIDRYCDIIKAGSGIVHRLEDWGRRRLAYPINKVHKAHYILMNIECEQVVLNKLESSFRYNDAVLRKLLLNRKTAITDPSPIKFSTSEFESASVKKTIKKLPETPENSLM